MNAWNKLSVIMALASVFGLAACGDSSAYFFDNEEINKNLRAAKEERDRRVIADYRLGVQMFNQVQRGKIQIGVHIKEISPKSMPDKVCVIAPTIVTMSCFEKSADINGNVGNAGKAGKMEAGYYLDDEEWVAVLEFTPVGNPEYRCIYSFTYAKWTDYGSAALSCLKP